MAHDSKSKSNYIMVVLLFGVTTLLLAIGAVGELLSALTKRSTSKEHQSEEIGEHETITQSI